MALNQLFKNLTFSIIGMDCDDLSDLTDEIKKASGIIIEYGERFKATYLIIGPGCDTVHEKTYIMINHFWIVRKILIFISD